MSTVAGAVAGAGISAEVGVRAGLLAVERVSSTVLWGMGKLGRSDSFKNSKKNLARFQEKILEKKLYAPENAFKITGYTLASPFILGAVAIPASLILGELACRAACIPFIAVLKEIPVLKENDDQKTF